MPATRPANPSPLEQQAPIVATLLPRECPTKSCKSLSDTWNDAMTMMTITRLRETLMAAAAAEVVLMRVMLVWEVTRGKRRFGSWRILKKSHKLWEDVENDIND